MAGKHPKYISNQMGHASAAFPLDTYGHLMERLPARPLEWIDDLVFPRGCTQNALVRRFMEYNGRSSGETVGGPEKARKSRT